MSHHADLVQKIPGPRHAKGREKNMQGVVFPDLLHAGHIPEMLVAGHEPYPAVFSGCMFA
jgi:hypothetical protein